jgi:GNAT superfamily N-acetyltransferase
VTQRQESHLRFEVVPAPDPPRWLPVLIDYAHKPLGRFYGADDRTAAEWLLADATRKSSALVQATDRRRLIGIASLARLPWESDVFGLAMGTVPLVAASERRDHRGEISRGLLRSLCTAARDEGIEHLSCRVPAGDSLLVQAAEQCGFLLADSTLEYLWRPRANSIAAPERWQLRQAREEDAESVAELARDAFLKRTATRFRNDPHLPASRVGELYAQWARRSCRGEFADVTVVALDAGEPVGFLTCKIERDLTGSLGRTLATIGIGAVRPEHEGQGLLTALVRAVLRWCAEHNVRLVRSRIMVQHVTSSWTALRTGARQIAAFHTFHKGLGPGEAAGDHDRC